MSVPQGAVNPREDELATDRRERRDAEAEENLDLAAAATRWDEILKRVNGED